MELGDKSPQRLLCKMKCSAFDGISPELLKKFWIQRLPAQIQQILSLSSDNLQTLSKMSDKGFEISRDNLVPSVSANFFLSSYVSVRASLKEPLNFPVAEMVYGAPIALPEEFFRVSKSLLTNDFLASLQQRMSSLRQIPMSQHCERKVFVYKELNNCS
ncbi:hypothetical protein AVEN_220887-1 [Araneus ventricosus]|uniref:Uncharacterized protein n=1 Tax=Araneus ventricosus TaxID=182803 RepID=A0A4Y2HYN0_ARAVE|nr:hypothetical protein AVEN_220887-1 [Araneus ventricosus]